MRDPARPDVDRVIREAMRKLDRSERWLPKDVPRGRRLYLPSGITSYTSEISSDYKAFLTPEDVGGTHTSEEESIALAASLPCDWVIRECSRLLRRLEQPGRYAPEEQLTFAREWAPEALRPEIERQIGEEGAMFLHPEQLLATMRLAIEHGSDRADAPLRDRMQTFSALLLSVDDRLTDEGPPEDANEDVYAAFGLRAMAFASSQILWHVLARIEATWFTVREMLGSSPKYVPVDTEFERTTGVRLSAFLAAITAAFAHTEAGFKKDDGSWVIEPRLFFSNTPDPVGMRRALDLLVGSRDWYRRAFAMRTAPRYLGIAMLPFRRRPLYQLGDGRLVALSAQYLVDAGMGGVYWTIADARSGDDPERRRFTDFVGEIHERFVLELVRSSVDPRTNVGIVYSDGDATPARSGADTVILGHGSGVFLETTSTALRYDQTVAPGDLTSFDREANEKIVRKIVQVEDAVADYRAGAIRYPTGSDASRLDRTIWPVVVLREPFPFFFLIGRRIARLLAATALTREHRADPPVRLMSVEEVELALEDGDPDRLRRLLIEWQMDDAYREESFRNFYLHRHPNERGKEPKYLRAAYRAAFERAGRELGFSPPPPDANAQ